jgi:hypothetical protein
MKKVQICENFHSFIILNLNTKMFIYQTVEGQRKILIAREKNFHYSNIDMKSCVNILLNLLYSLHV